MTRKVIELKGADRKLEIFNRTPTVAVINIYGEIGDSMWFDSISAKSFSDELKELPDTTNEIELRINSGGGDVFDGITIYNRLKNHKAKVTVYIDGLAASIASIIMLAGDEIIVNEGALVMIHKPWTMARGDSNALEETIRRLDDVEEQIISIYKRKTGIERAELRSMLSAETWMDAAQAVEYGFADRTFEDENLVAASIDNAIWIRKNPKIANSTDINKKRINDFKQEIKSFLARTKAQRK